MRIFAWALMSALAAPSAGAQAGTANLSGDAAEKRVESILRQMTVEEKIDLIAGVDFFYLRGVPRLGVPRLRMVDGPMGVRNDGPATAFGGGIALAATWNTELAERIGVEFGRDTRAKGGHFLLAPGVNIYRASIAARNFEYFGEDPFLASRMAVNFINGVQSQGVAATIKHFAANNSEFDRNNADSIVDERTLREIYLPAFEAAVKEAGVGAIKVYCLSGMESFAEIGREHDAALLVPGTNVLAVQVQPLQMQFAHLVFRTRIDEVDHVHHPLLVVDPVLLGRLGRHVGPLAHRVLDQLATGLDLHHVLHLLLLICRD